MRIYHLLILLIFFGLISSGCTRIVDFSKLSSPIHNRTGEYQKGENYSSLRWPPGIKPLPEDPYYVIPEIPNPEAGAMRLTPPGSLALEKQLASRRKN